MSIPKIKKQSKNKTKQKKQPKKVVAGKGALQAALPDLKKKDKEKEDLPSIGGEGTKSKEPIDADSLPPSMVSVEGDEDDFADLDGKEQKQDILDDEDDEQIKAPEEISKEDKKEEEPKKDGEGDKEKKQKGEDKDSPKHKEEFYPNAKTGYELTERGDEEKNKKLMSKMLTKMNLSGDNISALKALETKFDSYDLYSVFAFGNVYDNEKGELNKVDMKKLLDVVNPKEINDVKMLFEAISFGVGLYELDPKLVEQLIIEATNPSVKGMGNPFLQITTYSDSGAKTFEGFKAWCEALSQNKGLASKDWGKVSDITRDLAQTYDWDEIVEMVSSVKNMKELKSYVAKEAETGPLVTAKRTGGGFEDPEYVLQKTKEKKKKGSKRGGFSGDSGRKPVWQRNEGNSLPVFSVCNEEVVLRSSGLGGEDDLVKDVLFLDEAKKVFGEGADFILSFFGQPLEKKALEEALKNVSSSEQKKLAVLNWHDIVLASGVTLVSDFISKVLEQIKDVLSKQKMDEDDLMDLFSFASVSFGDVADILSEYERSDFSNVSDFIAVCNAIIENELTDKNVVDVVEYAEFLTKYYNVEQCLELAEKIEDIKKKEEISYLDGILDGIVQMSTQSDI